MLAWQVACGASAAPAGEVAPAEASADVDRARDWVQDSHDNQGMPYLIIDKINARVFVFAADGRRLGDGAALLGLARGDRAPEDIGRRPLSAIGPGDRITPAGRFVASLSRDVHGGEVLLVDYASALALHPVVKGTPAEHRAERLRSPSIQDNRISFGCINVPPRFFQDIVSPAFRRTAGVVYILPETAPVTTLFVSRPAVTGKADTNSSRE